MMHGFEITAEIKGHTEEDRWNVEIRISEVREGRQSGGTHVYQSKSRLRAKYGSVQKKLPELVLKAFKEVV